MFAEKRDKIMWAGVAAGTAALASIAVRQGMHAGWRAVKGEEPPRNPISSDVTWADAILYTAGVGLVVGVSRMVVQRAVAGYWKDKKHRKPPKL